MEMQNQRLTIGIRIGAKAPRAPKNRSRAFSPLCGFSPPQFGQGSMLRIALLPAQTVVYLKRYAQVLQKI